MKIYKCGENTLKWFESYQNMFQPTHTSRHYVPEINFITKYQNRIENCFKAACCIPEFLSGITFLLKSNKVAILKTLYLTTTGG